MNEYDIPDELPLDATIDVKRIMDRYDRETASVSVGRKDPGDYVRYRLEINNPTSGEETTEWMGVERFRDFVNGFTSACQFEELRVHGDL